MYSWGSSKEQRYILFVTKLSLWRAAKEMHWGRQLAIEWEEYEEKFGGKGSRYENYTALTEKGQNSLHIWVSHNQVRCQYLSHMSPLYYPKGKPCGPHKKIAGVLLHHHVFLRGKTQLPEDLAVMFWFLGEYCQPIKVKNYVLAYFKHLLKSLNWSEGAWGVVMKLIYAFILLFCVSKIVVMKCFKQTLHVVSSKHYRLFFCWEKSNEMTFFFICYSFQLLNLFLF